MVQQGVGADGRGGRSCSCCGSAAAGFEWVWGGGVQGIHCFALFASSVFRGCCNYAGAEEVRLVT